MRKAIIYLLLITQIMTSGCYKHVEIPRAEVRNGALFTPKETETFVVVRNTGRDEFHSVEIANDHVIGQLTNVKGVEEKSIPLANVTRIEKTTFSSGRTIALIAVSVVAIAAIVFGVAIGNSCRDDCP